MTGNDPIHVFEQLKLLPSPQRKCEYWPFCHCIHLNWLHVSWICWICYLDGFPTRLEANADPNLSMGVEDQRPHHFLAPQVPRYRMVPYPSRVGSSTSPRFQGCAKAVPRAKKKTCPPYILILDQLRTGRDILLICRHQWGCRLAIWSLFVAGSLNWPWHAVWTGQKYGLNH